MKRTKPIGKQKSLWSLDTLYIVGSVVIILIALSYVFDLKGIVYGHTQKIFPTPTMAPIPTVDPDPQTLCTWKISDGTRNCPDKQMKSSECLDSVCCNLYNGTWSSMSKVECAEFQAKNKPAAQRVQVPLPQFHEPQLIIPPAPQIKTTHCTPDFDGGGVTCTSY